VSPEFEAPPPVLGCLQYPFLSPLLGERIQHGMSTAERKCISTVCHQLVYQPPLQHETLSGVDLHLPRERIGKGGKEVNAYTDTILLQLSLVPQSKALLVF